MNYKLFDLDGTLIDSMSYWIDEMLSYLDKRNVEYPENIVEIITPLGSKGSAEYFINELGVKDTVENICATVEAYADNAYRNLIPLKKGVKEYLIREKNNGCSLNILTMCDLTSLSLCLKRTGVYDLFDNVWCCTDFGLTKADKEIFDKVADILKVSPEKIEFFDDSSVAIDSANKAGFYTVGVFDECSASFWERIKQSANMHIKSFEELL